MHQTRKELSKHIPLPKKGTKYVARAMSNIKNSVPVLIALRDMLKLAENAREVKALIHQKKIKLNGKLVHDMHQSIQLFNILDAGKQYVLTMLPTKKFSFSHSNSKERACKVVSRRLVSKNKIQLNLHDGTNIIGKESIKINDTIYLNFSNKIISHKPLEKGANIFIIFGKYAGSEGVLHSIKKGFASVKIHKEEIVLPLKNIFVT